ncbi:MAG: AMP-binding protein [Geminicoccaceae bacterium]
MQLPDLKALDTMPKLLLHNAANWPDEVAMREKDLGIWNEYSWADIANTTRRLGLGLLSLGEQRGRVVDIIGRNRPNWVWCQWAIQSVGAMSIGLYEDILADEAVYLLDYSEAEIVFCEDEEQVDKLVELGGRAQHLRWIIYHDSRGLRKYDDPRLISWDDFLAKGEEMARAEPNRFEAEVAAGQGEDVAILCTTSGTTSNPKLAELQHRRFLEHCATYLDADPREPTDDYVCLLPLPWIMEQVYVGCMPLLSRIRVNFPESGETAMHDLREIGPTHLLLAPRVWEQTAADVRARIMDASAFNRWIFHTCMKWGLSALEKGRRSWIADLLLFRTLKDRLGFRHVRSAATGGAALGPDTFKFFLAMGVPLRQLYGQTELCGAYTLQDAKTIEFNSSGRPFPGVEVRIDNPDPNGIGSIVTRHPNMFRGYFKNAEATEETLTDDGWMVTGDAGYFDDQGRLIVIDRLKDIATTANRERFSPQYIENKLKFSPYIGECVVLGHDRPFLTAILCIRYSMVAKWAESNRIGFTTYSNLASRPQTYDLIEGEVAQVNDSLPEAQRIQRFVLLFKELDADDGELPRTRKVRRSVVDERYGPIIEALYSGQDRIRMKAQVTFEDGRQGMIEADMVIRDMPSELAQAA